MGGGAGGGGGGTLESDALTFICLAVMLQSVRKISVFIRTRELAQYNGNLQGSRCFRLFPRPSKNVSATRSSGGKRQTKVAHRPQRDHRLLTEEICISILSPPPPPPPTLLLSPPHSPPPTPTPPRRHSSTPSETEKETESFLPHLLPPLPSLRTFEVTGATRGTHADAGILLMFSPSPRSLSLDSLSLSLSSLSRFRSAADVDGDSGGTEWGLWEKGTEGLCSS